MHNKDERRWELLFKQLTDRLTAQEIIELDILEKEVTKSQVYELNKPKFINHEEFSKTLA